MVGLADLPVMLSERKTSLSVCVCHIGIVLKYNELMQNSVFFFPPNFVPSVPELHQKAATIKPCCLGTLERLLNIYFLTYHPPPHAS